MKFNKSLRLAIIVIISLPVSFFIGNELLASHSSERFEYELQNENLIACGGGGGKSPAAKKKDAERKVQVKLLTKKKKLAEAAAEGKPTAELQSEVDALEALLE